MLDFLGGGKGQRAGEVFGQLMIEKRVLITPRSTISIPNITVIAIGTIKIPSRWVWALIAGLVAGAIGVLAAGDPRENPPVAATGLAMAVGALVLARYFSRTEKPCLFVSSSDGHVARFGGRRQTLEEVRRLLTDKINADDESAVYRVNFENGAIQAAGVGHADSIGALVAGGGNQAMGGPGDARLGAADAHPPALNSPGAKLGNGHFAAGNAYHVDYSQVLPHIVDMQRFYAQRQDTLDIAERLAELEHLLRSGTPSAVSRSRLSQLLGDLSGILGAYPGVVQVLQQVARLAGF